MKKRVLVTGAGGAAAVAFVQALEPGVYDVFMGDIDPYAAGLYLVPADHRVVLPRGDAPEFARRMLDICTSRDIDVLVPTVDVELQPIEALRASFESQGVALLMAGDGTLGLCLDKMVLMEACSGVVPVPQSAVYDEHFDPAAWLYPLILKPRSGSGSRGIVRVDTPSELNRIPRSEALMVQEYLPGAEYSVDVVRLPDANLCVAVPRERLKVDSGVAVAGRTLRDAELEAFGKAVAERIDLRFVANIQFRRDPQGRPALLEVNPRFPGTMPLTVAAGVDMPNIALRAVLGEAPPEEAPDFRELAMVRTWSETYVNPRDVARLEIACA